MDATSQLCFIQAANTDVCSISYCIQGDEERKLSMPVSPFMDREKPQVAELQRKFINNLITPVLLSMHRTGILAGEIPLDNGELVCCSFFSSRRKS